MNLKFVSQEVQPLKKERVDEVETDLQLVIASQLLILLSVKVGLNPGLQAAQNIVLLTSELTAVTVASFTKYMTYPQLATIAVKSVSSGRPKASGVLSKHLLSYPSSPLKVNASIWREELRNRTGILLLAHSKVDAWFSRGYILVRSNPVGEKGLSRLAISMFWLSRIFVVHD